MDIKSILNILKQIGIESGPDAPKQEDDIINEILRFSKSLSYHAKADKKEVSKPSVKKEEKQEVINIEQQIQKAQVKNNISVKEFAEIYHFSKTSQQNYRSRIHDPLPYHQKVQGGRIVYVVEEVEKWFENQHK